MYDAQYRKYNDHSHNSSTYHKKDGTPIRAILKREAQKEIEEFTMSCTSCGSPIPEGQGNSCSMCYGDIAHGTDGYYAQWAEEQERLRFEKEEQVRQWVTEGSFTIVIDCPYCDSKGWHLGHTLKSDGTYYPEPYASKPIQHQCYWCKGTGTIPAKSQNKEAIFND